MASATYKIDQFFGIDESAEENFLGSGYTANACNMCTDDGNLNVAKGFTRFIKFPIPSDEANSKVDRCVLFRHSDGDMYIAASGNSLYVGFGTVWLKAYTYSQELQNHDFDFLAVKIGNQDCLLIGNGETGLVKFDGSDFSDFGSEELCSNHPVRYLAMYKNRLFAAGDKNHPNRLYWSKLPGDNRSIEDWGPDDSSPNVEGGHTQIGLFDSDPIVAITPLASQLLIFKKNSLYRLYGDKPSNFTVEEIESVMEYTPHTSIIHYGDVAFFMTHAGLYVFDGVSAHLMQDASRIKKIMARADTSKTKGARTREKLYFTVVLDGSDAIIEYDINRHTYMLRTGFDVRDMFSRDNAIYIISDRYVCRFNDGDSYAGEAIHAHWCTPLTDLNNKATVKQLCELYLRGETNDKDIIEVVTETGGFSRKYNIRLIDGEVTEIPLLDEGRCFRLTFSNTAGGSFSLRGGIEMRINIRGRCI